MTKLCKSLDLELMKHWMTALRMCSLVQDLIFYWHQRMRLRDWNAFEAWQILESPSRAEPQSSWTMLPRDTGIETPPPQEHRWGTDGQASAWP